MNFIHSKEAQENEYSMDNTKYGCVVRKTYNLSCACIIIKKVMHETSI